MPFSALRQKWPKLSPTELLFFLWYPMELWDPQWFFQNSKWLWCHKLAGQIRHFNFICRYQRLSIFMVVLVVSPPRRHALPWSARAPPHPRTCATRTYGCSSGAGDPPSSAVSRRGLPPSATGAQSGRSWPWSRDPPASSSVRWRQLAKKFWRLSTPRSFLLSSSTMVVCILR